MQKETFGSICMENEQLHGNYLQIYPVWQRYTVKTKRLIFKRAVLACVMNCQLQIIYSFTYIHVDSVVRTLSNVTCVTCRHLGFTLSGIYVTFVITHPDYCCSNVLVRS